jgi:hypothetical protein
LRAGGDHWAGGLPRGLGSASVFHRLQHQEPALAILAPASHKNCGPKPIEDARFGFARSFRQAHGTVGAGASQERRYHHSKPPDDDGDHRKRKSH